MGTPCTMADPIPHFQVWGSKSQPRQFFRFLPSPNFLQRSINGECFLKNFIDWLIDCLIWVVIGIITKNCLDWDSNPRPGNVLHVLQFSVLWQFPFHVSWSGVRNPSHGNFFRFFSVSQLSPTVNQWRIFFESLYRLIDWLINMSCHWSHIKQNCLDWDSNPRPGNTWDLMWNWDCHSTQWSNGCSLGSLLFPRRYYHVQRCVLPWKNLSFWNFNRNYV